MEQGDMSNNADRPSIKTFVMFDTETTGFPNHLDNPQITELCFIALTRDELLTEQREPLVLNKLVLCFNPGKEICSIASNLSGLYNKALELMEPFEKQAPLICAFLKNLPQPACLIAHSGNRFHFKLLVAQLRLTNEGVPKDILCAGSLKAFRKFDNLPPVPDSVLEKRAKAAGLDVKSSGTLRQIPGDVCVKNEISQTIAGSSIIGDRKSSYGDQDTCSYHQEESSCDVKPKWPKLSATHTEIQNNSEHTPCRSSLRKMKTWPPLLLTKGDGDIQSSLQKEKNSYSLKNLYARVFGHDYDRAHTAEGDCSALLKIICDQRDEFLPWCDLNAVPLQSIKPMY